MKIYVDLDDVLADTVPHFLDIARARFGRDVRFEQVHSFDLAQSLGFDPAVYEEFMRFVHQPDILIDIPPIAGATETVESWVQRGDEVIVATGRPTSSTAVCEEWLGNRFAGTKLLVVDKYSRQVLDGTAPGIPLGSIPEMGFDVVIEDSSDVALCLANRIRCVILLLERPWNRHRLTALPREILPVRDWGQIATMVDSLRC